MALALGAAGCQQSAQQAKAAAIAAAAPATPYSAIADGKADVEGGIIQVAARAPGVVSAVYVEEGDAVRKGQVLARQEDDAPRPGRVRPPRRRSPRPGPPPRSPTPSAPPPNERWRG